MYYAMLVEFLHYKNVSNVFIISCFMSLWCLEMSKLAIVVHFQIINLMDFFPSVFPYQNYVKVAWGLVSFIITIAMNNKVI